MAYTAADADRLTRRGGLEEDKTLPILRFERTTIEDRIESDRQGRYVHGNVIIVHVKAPGDMKNEIPYIAEGFEYIGGKKQACNPWIKILEDRLHHGMVHPDVVNFCKDALARFKANEELPTSGTPVKVWNAISPAEQMNLVSIGIVSIEQAAEMTEEAMTNFGMGAREIKRKAIAYIQQATEPEKAAQRMAQLEADKEHQSQTIDDLQSKLADLAGRFEDMEKKAQVNKRSTRRKTENTIEE